MDVFRIPVEHHRALAAYYERMLDCSFVLNGVEVGHGEVFHHSGFLPLVVEQASQLSEHVFSQPLPATFVQTEHSLLGQRVEIAEDAPQPVLLLLSRAADLLFSPEKGKTIELYPMFAYSMLPRDQRARSEWQPARF
jgi:hypothetical protein